MRPFKCLPKLNFLGVIILNGNRVVKIIQIAIRKWVCDSAWKSTTRSWIVPNEKPLVTCTAPISILVEQKSEMCYRYHEVYQNLAMGFLNTLNWINVFDRFSIYNDQHDNNDADINSLTLFKWLSIENLSKHQFNMACLKQNL